MCELYDNNASRAKIIYFVPKPSGLLQYIGKNGEKLQLDRRKYIHKPITHRIKPQIRQLFQPYCLQAGFVLLHIPAFVLGINAHEYHGSIVPEEQSHICLHWLSVLRYGELERCRFVTIKADVFLFKIAVSNITLSGCIHHLLDPALRLLPGKLRSGDNGDAREHFLRVFLRQPFGCVHICVAGKALVFKARDIGIEDEVPLSVYAKTKQQEGRDQHQTLIHNVNIGIAY